MYLQYYLKQLGYSNIPEFIVKYLKAPSLIRLKGIGYFCGMDYASKEIYDFKEPITRFDHSLTVALLVYKLTQDKNATLAGLFHDVGTPCFSHAIDYMNQDYEKQESTEAFTERILKKDLYLKDCLQKDRIGVEDLIHFKKFTIVDNDRPKVCADRIDGVILTGIAWTKNIHKKDIDQIVEDMCISVNEDQEQEIGFQSQEIAEKVLEVSQSIDIYCHSKEDNYMMHLLAQIAKTAIEREYITYEDLYKYEEKQLLSLLKSQKDSSLQSLIRVFETIRKDEIPTMVVPSTVKIRDLNPLVKGKRLK